MEKQRYIEIQNEKEKIRQKEREEPKVGVFRNVADS